MTEMTQILTRQLQLWSGSDILTHPYVQGQALGHAWNGTGSINCAHAEVLFYFQITQWCEPTRSPFHHFRPHTEENSQSILVLILAL